MTKPLFIIVLFCSILFADGVKKKEPFDLDMPNIIGTHPGFLISLFVEGYIAIELDYLREVEAVDLLGRFTFANDYDGDIFNRFYVIETGVRKPFYLAHKKYARFGPYLQVSMINSFHSNTHYKEYLGSIIGTVGLRLQLKRLVVDLDVGVGPQFESHYREFDLNIQPNLMLGIAF